MVLKEVLVVWAWEGAVEGGRKSSQGLARERMEVWIPWVSGVSEFGYLGRRRRGGEDP